MTLEQAKQYLGYNWLLHPRYKLENNPWHSMRWNIDVRITFARVRARQKDVASLRLVFALHRNFERKDVHGLPRRSAGQRPD
jgi:hypothetical protein